MTDQPIHNVDLLRHSDDSGSYFVCQICGRIMVYPDDGPPEVGATGNPEAIHRGVYSSIPGLTLSIGAPQAEQGDELPRPFAEWAEGHDWGRDE